LDYFIAGKLRSQEVLETLKLLNWKGGGTELGLNVKRGEGREEMKVEWFNGLMV